MFIHPYYLEESEDPMDDTDIFMANLQALYAETGREFIIAENIEDIKKNFTMKIQGSEAKIYEGTYAGKEAILKERFQKKYRHPELDRRLTTERTKAEIRGLNKCLSIGIMCPGALLCDVQKGLIVLEKIPDAVTVKELLTDCCNSSGAEGITSLLPLAKKIGSIIAEMHKNDLVHGDLTTSNMLIKKADIEKIGSKKYDLFMIDFGLSKRDADLEDKAVDLYVLERAISSSHPEAEEFYNAIKNEYFSVGGKAFHHVLSKLEEVRQRGRKRLMVG